jgi:hypothetical protein
VDEGRHQRAGRQLLSLHSAPLSCVTSPARPTIHRSNPSSLPIFFCAPQYYRGRSLSEVAALQEAVSGAGTVTSAPARAAILTEVDARSRPSQPLVVMASLLDKPPNLGGLARTSEVFRLHTMTVHDIRIKVVACCVVRCVVASLAPRHIASLAVTTSRLSPRDVALSLDGRSA